MTKNIYVILLSGLSLFYGCSDDATEEPQVTVALQIDFTHNWDGEAVTPDDLNTVKYTNAIGQLMSVELLRYLVSDFTFEKADGSTLTIEEYNLVNLTNGTGLSFEIPGGIEEGDYTNVSFTFGFDNEDNVDGAYLDLNSASWNVPMMLGGGYHFMQLEGKFLNVTEGEIGYQYHAIRAVDNSGESQRFQDTFFTVNLGPMTINGNTNVSVGMNIAEWFKNPNQWDLNVLGSMLMPNFDAQVMIHENGQGVFGLESPQ